MITNYKNLFPVYKNVIYLDSSTYPQKPKIIINKLKKDLSNFFYPPYKNIYQENLKNEKQIETTKKTIAKFLNVKENEIFFTFGSTDSLKKLVKLINEKINPEEEILFSKDDHNEVVKNIKKINAKKIEYDLFPHSGDCDWRDINKKINNKTKFIFVNHIHGIYGLEAETEKIDKKNSFLLLDLSQSISRIRCDLKFKKADAAFFSGYKIFGLEGIGVCYINEKLQNYFSKEKIKKIFSQRNIPFIGIKSIYYGINFINKIGIDNIHMYLTNITQEAIKNLIKISNLEFLPGAYYTNCATGYGILSFYINGISPAEIIPFLEKNNIYLRGEKLCYNQNYQKQPFFRISMHINNDTEDINKLVEFLKIIL